MIVAALILASAAADAAPQGTTPFASMEVMSSLPRAPREAEKACAEPVTVEVSVTLVSEGKVETVSVSPIDCDPGLAERLSGWINSLPAASFRPVTKPTSFSFRMYFLPQG